ncbi:conjugal transfer protein TraB [Phyllobacterium phragmitis]|uniref:conjugal transfer protein TraB n=1 Tax=Phyllobacterium phragmitis TaxID=2670329 RepID=UPI001FDFCAB9|nr:conjugal transfer protein TraB [Phyllobacterium phragmitis]
MIREPLRSIALVCAAVLVGLVGWSGNPLTLPVAMFFPALWAFSPSRLVTAAISAGYFLAAARGLPEGVANFYGSGLGAGFALWFAAASGFVIVHTALWTARPGWGRALRYCIAAVAMSVPPFGIAGWAHPITAAGVVFPGWGWFGLAVAAIGLLVITSKAWPIATLVLGGLCLWSAAMWTPPDMPQGWVGVDTTFRGESGQYADYAQQIETIELIKAAAGEGAKVIVLPESAAGIWTPTAAHLWTRELTGLDVTVNAGAIIVNETGYDNVMMEITGEGISVLYSERMPVPVSMWQPWLAWTGAPAGARAHFFANPLVDLAGRRVAPLICYEQLIIWPILQSAFHPPDVIVATGNGWWTDNTNIVAIQKASAQAWARLFNLPLVMAFNL